MLKKSEGRFCGFVSVFDFGATDPWTGAIRIGSYGQPSLAEHKTLDGSMSLSRDKSYL